MSKKSLSIKELASAVVDNGRRGAPLNGCDCLQCFGYCMIDREVAQRALIQTRNMRGASAHYTAALDVQLAHAGEAYGDWK
jgi:hypothetical protein